MYTNGVTDTNNNSISTNAFPWRIINHVSVTTINWNMI